MPAAELTMRAAIWVAMAGYAASSIVELNRHPSRLRTRLVIILYLSGFLAYVLHVFLAFELFYDWSHKIAWNETARLTEAATGFHMGHGIYANYVFGIVWLIALCLRLRRHLRPSAATKTSRFTQIALHTMFLFMMLNGGILFATGLVRWFTAFLMLSLIIAWWANWRKRPYGQ